MDFKISESAKDKYSFIKMPVQSSAKTSEVPVSEDFLALFDNNKNIFGTLGKTVPLNSTSPILRDPVNANSDRLNDLDTNLLKNNAHIQIDDETLKLEQQINNTLKELSTVNAKIAQLSILNLEYDKKRIEDYKNKKLALEAKLREYRSNYRDLGLICNASDVMSEVLQKADSKIKQGKNEAKNSFIINFASKIFPGINRNLELRNTISDMTLINNSLSELMQHKVSPIGEADQQRDALVAFLSKANEIELKIANALSEY